MTKPKLSKLLSTAALCVAAPVLSSLSGAVRSADFIFVVDESGSMSGEQNFLEEQVPSLEAGLVGASVTGSRYALVGFGSGNPEPRPFTVGAGQFGTAAEFQTAAKTLETSGGTEDGYAGIAYTLANYKFRSGVLPVIVLVTDEDRDVLPEYSTQTATSIKTALAGANATWISILDQSILDKNGVKISNALVINSQNRVYIADGTGGVTTQESGQVAATSDTTKADYSDPTLESGGLVADLNVLRDGGQNASSFTKTFLDNLVRVVNVNLGLLELASDPRLNSFSQVFSPLVRTNSNVADLFNQVSADPARFSSRIRQFQGYRYGQTGRSSASGAYNYTFVLNNRFDELQRETLADLASGSETIHGDRRWGTFAQAAFSQSDTEVSKDNVNGGEAHNWGAMAGADYAFSKRLHAGLAIGHKETDESDSDDIFSSDLNGETETLMGYAAMHLDPGIFLEGTVGVGIADLSQVRRLGGGGRANGEIDQFITSGSLRATLPLQYRGFSYGARAQMQWIRIETDDTIESGAGALNLTIPKHTDDTVRSLLGLYIERPFNLAGHRWIPRASVDWVRDFTQEDPLSVSFTSTPGSAFLLAPDPVAENTGRASLGNTFYIHETFSVYLNYTRNFASPDRTDEVIYTGVNYRF